MAQLTNSTAPLLLQAASGANKQSTIAGARYSIVAEFIRDYRFMRKRVEGRGWLPIILVTEIDHPEFSRRLTRRRSIATAALYEQVIVCASTASPMTEASWIAPARSHPIPSRWSAKL
jgi:hypothetical protein